MISYLKTAYFYIEKGYVSGIRISTRPDYIDKRILDILKKYGVNSIELGVQSMDNKVLYLCERGHTSKDVIDAVKLIKEYDFELVLQMMCNLYGSKHDDVFETGKKIAALKPDGVRIYPTMVIKNTALEQLYRSGKYIPENLENTVEICAKLYMLFYENDINVLRMGLYSDRELIEEGNIVAGCFHPSFGELVFSRMYLDKAKEKIRDGKFKDKDIEIFVKPGSISKMAGNKKQNVTKLLQEFCIKSIKIKEDSTLSDFEVKIFERQV